MRNLFYKRILRIGLELFFKTRIGFGLDNFGSDFKHKAIVGLLLLLLWTIFQHGTISPILKLVMYKI
jgi:hypothetical protein